MHDTLTAKDPKQQGLKGLKVSDPIMFKYCYSMVEVGAERPGSSITYWPNSSVGSMETKALIVYTLGVYTLGVYTLGV